MLAERIVARLDREFSYHFHVEAVLWEREPLVATHHPQDPRNIPRPSSTDIVVVILWARIGVPLPESEFRGAISGRPVTGTEWEFEDALAAAREHDGIPELLVYRKRASIPATLDDDEALEAMRAQKRLLEDFIARWFGSAANHDVSAALHSFETAQEFELALYEHLVVLLERRAGRLSEHAAIRWHSAPFRGLESFDLKHAEIFFGRTRARNELREALARQVAAHSRTLLIVAGASGSGKSSLVKAGLLPDLMLPGMLDRVALCRYAVVRPANAESNPLRALALAISGQTALPELRDLQYAGDQLEDLLRAAPGQASLPIRQGLAAAAKLRGVGPNGEARLIIIVDQLEEVFTDTSIGADRRREFIAALDALARTGLVWVVATLRSDFIDRLGQFSELDNAANSAGLYFLSLPTDIEFAQIIRQPAREAGLVFEAAADGSTLDETIRQATAGNPNVLPLLSFLLDELWRSRTLDGTLTFDAYHRLGGLEGALAKRAEHVFLSQSHQVQAALPRVLRALVTAETGTQVTARTALLAEFPEGSDERSLIDAFASTDARLLVKSGEAGASTVRVSHEALLTRWQRAAESLAKDRDDIELASRLRRDASRWNSAASTDKASLLLPSGLPLEEARDLERRRADELDTVVRAYITASVIAERRQKVRQRIVAVAAFAILAAISAFATLQWNSERASARAAHALNLAGVSNARDRSDYGDPVGAMFAVAAYAAVPESATAGAVLRQLSELSALHQTRAPSWRFADFADQGNFVVVETGNQGDGPFSVPGRDLMVLNATDLSLQSYTPGLNAVSLCGFRNAPRIALANANAVTFYDISGSAPGAIGRVALPAPALAIVCRSNGSGAIVALRNGEIRQVGVGTGDSRPLVSFPGATVIGLRLSPGGTWLGVVTASDHVLTIVRTSDGRVRTHVPLAFAQLSLCEHANCVGNFAFSNDDRRIASCLPGGSSMAVASIANPAARFRYAAPGCAYPSSTLIPFDGGAPSIISGGETDAFQTGRFLVNSTYHLEVSLHSPYAFDDVRQEYVGGEESGLALRSLAPISVPLLGRQGSSGFPGSFVMTDAAMVLAGAARFHSYDLDRYRSQFAESDDIGPEVLSDSGNGRNAAAFNMKTGRLSILNLSPDRLAQGTETLATFELPPIVQTDAAPQIGYDPDSKIVTLVSSSGLRRFSLDRGEISNAASGLSALMARVHARPFQTGTFGINFKLSPRGDYIILGNTNVQGVPLLATIDGRLLAAFGTRPKNDIPDMDDNALTSASFSPSERYVFFAPAVGEVGIHAFTLPDLSEIAGVDIVTQSPVALSPDERTLAYYTQDGRAQLYSFSERLPIGPPLPAAPVSSDERYGLKAFAFSRDGRHLVMNYWEDLQSWLAVYSVDPPDWERSVCLAFGRPLTAEEARPVAESLENLDPCAPYAENVVDRSILNLPSSRW